MDWKDIASDIAKFAPIIGDVIAGPAGAIVGTAVSKILGVADTPEAVKNHIENNRAAEQALYVYQARNMEALKNLAAVAKTEAETQKSRALDSRFFIAAAQPFIVWSCGAGLLYSLVFAPIVNGIFALHLASADLPQLAGMLTVLLGHGAQKTIESYLTKKD